jgi:hypothetical protein
MPGKVNFGKIGVPLALALLAVWAVLTFAFEAPGWVHLLLTVGVFLLIYGIVVRGTPPVDAPDRRR